MRTYLQSKAMAKSLRESLAAKNIALSHGECLDIVARQFGFGHWNILATKIGIETSDLASQSASGAVRLFQVLPVLRVASREAARAFYAGVLGFRFDWGDEEPSGERAFYAQVSRSELQLHLTTEPLGEGRAISDVYFRMKGLDALHQEISGKLGSGRKSVLRHTNYDARELEIEDPFGNLLRFVENNPAGMAAP